MALNPIVVVSKKFRPYQLDVSSLAYQAFIETVPGTRRRGCRKRRCRVEVMDGLTAACAWIWLLSKGEPRSCHCGGSIPAIVRSN